MSILAVLSSLLLNNPTLAAPLAAEPVQVHLHRGDLFYFGSDGVGGWYGCRPEAPATSRLEPARLQQLLEHAFELPGTHRMIERLHEARALETPGRADSGPERIFVAVGDCAFDRAKTGPAVVPLTAPEARWVLALSDARWASLRDWLGAVGSPASPRARLLDDILSHELMHAVMIELLKPATIARSAREQIPIFSHDVDKQTDTATAFWEGTAIAMEAELSQSWGAPLDLGPDGTAAELARLLNGRHAPVRANRYAHTPEGLLKKPFELVTSEGFVATYTYYLLKLMTFEEFAAMIHAEQPADTLEFFEAAFKHGGAPALDLFLELSQYVTVNPDAYPLALRLERLRQLAPSSTRLTEAEAQWEARRAQWREELFFPTEGSSPRDPLAQARALPIFRR